MKRILTALALIAAVAGAGTLSWTRGASAQSAAFDAGQVSEIEKIVREYLLAHPEVLREVFTALDEKESRERDEKLVSTITEKGSDIFNNPADVVLGNPDGDVTMVEFFDYNCGYCKRALSDMTALLESDSNLRIVLKEFPILTPGSVEAAKVSLAVGRQASAETFTDFHAKLLSARGSTDGARALQVAEGLGLDMDKLRADMGAPDIEKHIQDTQELASNLGVDGTPAYVIGKKLVPGAIGADGLRKAIEEARATD